MKNVSLTALIMLSGMTDTFADTKAGDDINTNISQLSVLLSLFSSLFIYLQKRRVITFRSSVVNNRILSWLSISSLLCSASFYIFIWC